LSNFIILNKRGLKHALSFSNLNYVQKLKSLYSIEDIIEKAVFYKVETDKRERENIKEIILMKNRIKIEDVIYDIQIIVRHTNEGRFYYDHALIETKKEVKSM